jgi:tyrosinase
MHLFLSSGLLLACLAKVAISSAPLSKRQAGCTNPTTRVHWTDLTNDEKTSYVAATKCLRSKPSVTGLDNSHNLWDDFVAVHITLDDNIHNVAAMLPWHSGFVYAREVHLRNCGFQGRMPGWNWTVYADRNAPFSDPVLTARSGLGGNGNPNEDYAVTNGPFTRLKVNLVDEGHSIVLSPHKLQREFNSDDGRPHHGAIGFSDLRSTKTINTLMGKQSYGDFR